MDPHVTRALVKVVELQDAVTAAHTWRVALYTQALAEYLGLPVEHVRRAMHAAVLHDVGKIDIPRAILAKPAALTDDEYAVIKQHAVLGHERLVRMGEDDPLILALVRSHHERIDGSGYPDRLAGDEIPESARWFAVVDSFDAMTSLRPYRTLAGRDAAKSAIEELNAGAGSLYCTECVDGFTTLFESGDLDWILEHYNDQATLRGLSIAPNALMIASARSEPVLGAGIFAQSAATQNLAS